MISAAHPVICQCAIAMPLLNVTDPLAYFLSGFSPLRSGFNDFVRSSAPLLLACPKEFVLLFASSGILASGLHCIDQLDLDTMWRDNSPIDLIHLPVEIDILHTQLVRDFIGRR